MTAATVLRFDRSKARQLPVPALYRDAAEVSMAVSTEAPMFCFSATTLVAQARTFIEGFPGEVSFAVKSNSSADVVKTLHSTGLRVWDVASVLEMDLVAGLAPGATFHYHNPVKSAAEIKAALERHNCRRFAVDCVEELQKIAAIVESRSEVEIAVRFVLPRETGSSAHDFSSKFGVSETEATDLLRQAAGLGFVPVLTFHPGSQCKDPQAYARHIHAAARIARAAGITLGTLNVGGGFPSRYAQSKTGNELPEFFSVIRVATEMAFGAATMPKLECEPGRGMAASCMSLLTKVKLLRDSKSEIFLNDGVYGALMEVWQVPELQPPHRVIRDGVAVEDRSRLVTVYGPTCDPLDKLPMQLAVPADIREGDIIEFGALGAYGSATMTRFNGYGGHETVHVRQVFKA